MSLMYKTNGCGLYIQPCGTVQIGWLYWKTDHFQIALFDAVLKTCFKTNPGFFLLLHSVVTYKASINHGPLGRRRFVFKSINGGPHLPIYVFQNIISVTLV